MIGTAFAKVRGIQYISYTWKYFANSGNFKRDWHADLLFEILRNPA